MQPAPQKVFVEDAWQPPRVTPTLRAYMALQNEEIAQRLVALREAKGKPPQTAVAAALDVGERTVQSWEQGEAKPGYRSLQKLAAYYEVGEDYILTGSTSAETPNPFRLSDQMNEVVSRVSRRVNEVDARLAGIERNIQAIADTQQSGEQAQAIMSLLARQSALLERIEELVRPLEGVKDVVSEPAATGELPAVQGPEPAAPLPQDEQPDTRTTGHDDRRVHDRRQDSA